MPTTPTTTARTPLTAREEQVLALIARGRSNTEIAAELGISFHTAKAHVEHILVKLDVGSREEAARWWDAQRLSPEPSVFARWVRAIARLPWPRIGMAAGIGVLAIAAVGVAALVVLSLPSNEEAADSAGVTVVPTEPPSTPAASPTDNATPTSQPSPEPPGRSTSTILEEADGPLLVSWTEERVENDGTRSWPVMAVDVYDTAAAETLSTFEVGGRGTFAFSAYLAGTEIIADHGHSVVAYGLDGTSRVIWQDPTKRSVVGIAISPDETMVAVGVDRTPAPYSDGTPCREDCPPPRLEFVDLETATTVGTVVLPDDFYGAPLPYIWRDTGDAVLVFHTIGKDGVEAQWSTVAMDGTITTEPVNLNPAPNGRYAAQTDGQYGTPEQCPSFYSSDLHLIDLVTDEVLWSINTPGYALSVVDWSPDGTRALVQHHTITTGSCTEEMLQQGNDYVLVTLPQGTATPVSDPQEVHQEFHGSMPVTFTCGGAPVPGVFRPRIQHYGCGSMAERPDVVLNYEGRTVASGRAITVLGTIDPQATGSN